MKTYISLTILAAFTITLLAGCGEGAKSVSWYKEHKTERDAKLTWCSNDVSRAMSNPDCLNAHKARALSSVDSNAPSVADTYEYTPSKKGAAP
jgi:hypothetical protein